ncbi:hypothetical protein D9758_011498 [Tetrapyrgos nigripes]|uniref:Hydrophobin n=1 Tax=Tetrapyrgos nigripes TaxID=182062 RepID=A0A8H5CTE6_9AGAR|nr:hypothetical protein D9758_011498 [Tetrapyrgos nigripes]
MFSRISTLFLLYLSSPPTLRSPQESTSDHDHHGDCSSQCNTGPIQCCDSVDKAGSSAVSPILGLLGVVIQDLNVLVGINCSPISVIGVGGDSCSATPVCCENNTFNGLIAVGCVPVIINL